MLPLKARLIKANKKKLDFLVIKLLKLYYKHKLITKFLESI